MWSIGYHFDRLRMIPFVRNVGYCVADGNLGASGDNHSSELLNLKIRETKCVFLAISLLFLFPRTSYLELPVKPMRIRKHRTIDSNTVTD